MPILKLQCNQSIGNQQEFMQQATAMLSELLGKPEKYIMISMEVADMMFAGTTATCLYAELKSIGLPEEHTTELSEALCRFFRERLDIPEDRIYIEFTNTARDLLGWNRKTFAT